MLFTLTSIAALVASAYAAAPAVLYPRSTSVWYSGQTHNVTWNPQAGRGDIIFNGGGMNKPLKTNVDLNAGRTEIRVPNAPNGASYVINIQVGNDRSTSGNFAIGSSAAASGATSIVASASSAASSLISSVESAASSASSAAVSATSAAESAASSIASAVESASGSAASEVASASSAILASASSALASAVSSGASVISSVAASGTSVIASVKSSATAPASGSPSPSGSSASKAEFGMGAVLAAGLVAITTLSGALIL